jgi:dTDP-4-amino-4,6-dideoxygalactose transaminase
MQTLETNITARRARVRAYRELLGGDGRPELIGHREGSACLTQVMRLQPRRRQDDQAARIIEGLAAAGFEVQGSSVPIHLLPLSESCRWRGLTHAEKVWEDLIELPCEPEMKISHVEHIAAIIKQLLRR